MKESPHSETGTKCSHCNKISNDLACRHMRFVQFVHDTELQLLHVSILEFECVSLESKLSNLLGVCSKELLRVSVELLHP